MPKKAINKEKSMKEVSKGFEGFIKKRKKKIASKSSFNKLLTKVAKQSSAE